jgi:hypothetical protein
MLTMSSAMLLLAGESHFHSFAKVSQENLACLLNASLTGRADLGGMLKLPHNVSNVCASFVFVKLVYDLVAKKFFLAGEVRLSVSVRSRISMSVCWCTG